MEPTEKQIKFAKSLKIDAPEQYSKETLTELINKKVEKAKPEPTETEKTQPDASKREYHLSIEQVRTNALNAAFSFATLIKADKTSIDSIISIAAAFEAYLNRK